jgi:hypothetical protein
MIIKDKNGAYIGQSCVNDEELQADIEQEYAKIKADPHYMYLTYWRIKTPNSSQPKVIEAEDITYEDVTPKQLTNGKARD